MASKISFGTWQTSTTLHGIGKEQFENQVVGGFKVFDTNCLAILWSSVRQLQGGRFYRYYCPSRREEGRNLGEKPALFVKLFSDFNPIHLQHSHFLQHYPLPRYQPLQAVHGN